MITEQEIFEMLPKTWKSGTKRGHMPKCIAKDTAHRIFTALDTKQEKTYTMKQVIAMVEMAEAMGGLSHINEILRKAEGTGTMGER